MTPAQIEKQLRQELGINERLAKLLHLHAKAVADKAYRSTANSLDHAHLLRCTGEAQGIERFVESIIPSRLINRDEEL